MNKKGGKPGRPPIPIDPAVVEGMASVGATNAEIGEFVGADGDTIGRRFADILAKARAGMRMRLRQAQFKSAVGGNATMMIWLGKQMLGQKDSLITKGVPNPTLVREMASAVVRHTGASEEAVQAVYREWALTLGRAAAGE